MKETTIAMLMIERNKLTERMRSWFFSCNQSIMLLDAIDQIDKLIIELNQEKKMIIPKLIWLDDLRNPFEKDCTDWLDKGSPIEQPYETIWAKSYEEFTKWILKNGLPAAVLFDHDLGEDVAREKVAKGMPKKKARQQNKVAKSGMDAAKFLVEYCLDNKLPLPKYNIQSRNPAGKENINGLLLSFNKNNNFYKK